ncbi:hypothetical protein [Paraflavitalea sp. CAU 1676]|uniref:hypothetical protein n=1 Tax=Paraflavitalea sp. CAU 1676 TaxID=3032598 RepID=UPI0023DC48F6|nr:hypothetical protein [Paraflavitalea sp. CAU 1676]MDF2189270.1 hypothetical protein [Paraflavitalea sp. CAU 1676]
MITYLIMHALLVGFNLLNVKHDAYRITKHKAIAHGLNFGVFTLFCALLCLLSRWNVGVITLFSVSAFFNRQLSFDIPLNLRRKLPWYYQSTANPPKALMDRIERKIFGNLSGKWIATVYAAGWLICLLIKTFL